ncbi:hypothetical protein KBD49_05405 [Myxococcota bacterium]|nr:hypothetical protein [Myxococcota bacterium]
MREVRLASTVMVDLRDRTGPGGTCRWNEDGTRAAPDPREFFPDLDRPARMDLPSRFVLAAGGLIPPLPKALRDATGVVLGTATGCLAVDRDFAATLALRPQPSLYARTLPTTAGAELSRALGLRGPGLAVVQETSPGYQALVTAWQEAASGACDAVICGEYHVPPADGTAPWVVLALLVAVSCDSPGRLLECRYLGAGDPGPGADLRDLLGSLGERGPWQREVLLEGGRWRVSLAAVSE